MAQASGVGLEIDFERLPVYEQFYELVRKGVSTGCTGSNQENAARFFDDQANLAPEQLELLSDPQTSGGLLLSVPSGQSTALVGALKNSGHTAALIGRSIDGPVRIVVR